MTAHFPPISHPISFLCALFFPYLLFSQYLARICFHDDNPSKVLDHKLQLAACDCGCEFSQQMASPPSARRWLSWKDFFMSVAFLAAERSKDPKSVLSLR